MAWLAKASRPISAFDDGSVVWDVLDALATKLDGTPAAPDYFSRRRGVLHRVLSYAVRKKRLEKNPLSKHNLPEGWTAPAKPEEQVDPRSVGSPALIAAMLAMCATIGRNQGPRFVAFFGCMYDAMMRPSDVAALTLNGCHLPATGWGYLTFADSSTAAGTAFTDDGTVHEHRGLKGRTRGRSTESSTPSRPPSPDPAGAGRPPPPSTSHDSASARTPASSVARTATSFSRPLGACLGQSPRQVADSQAAPDSLLRRPSDLRHSGITWRLNSGVPATEVAAWAGHSVEVLMRIYSKCMTAWRTSGSPA